MEDRLNRIDEKLDRVAELQAEMGASLKEHMRRTELAEQSIQQIVQSLKPIQEHVAFIRGLGKLLTWGSGLVVAIITIVRAFLIPGGK